MKKLLKFFPFIFFLPLLLVSCEEDITVELPRGEDRIVIEGHIENGLIPYVILTRNSPYFDNFKLEEIQELFDTSAKVMVSNGVKTVELKRLSLTDTSRQTRQLLANIFQLAPEAFEGDEPLALPFYTPLTLQDLMFGEVGKSYTLTVTSGEFIATAKTTIPPPASVDSVFVELEEDDYYRLFIRFKDEPGVDNYYRYFTRRNDEPYYPGYFGSVADDNLVDGKSPIINLDRGYPKTGAPDFQHYGLFPKGDTVYVKFCSIDKDQFEFWNSLEEDFRNQGSPFGAATRVPSNVNGGLGIWGGYGCVYDTVVIK